VDRWRQWFSVAGAPKWSVALSALVGAWVGHFLEYVRVAGWHAGVAEMATSVHTYFFPAGAGLMAVAAGGAVMARRVWARLGRRLRADDNGLRKPHAARPALAESGAPPNVGLVGVWLVLAVLQLGTWTIQENLEAVAAGNRAPLGAVLAGAHWLAPVVVAEVALILAVGYVCLHRLFGRRRSRVEVLERLVARRWRRGQIRVALPAAPVMASSPLQRWGAQRWQRPPPTGLIA
jgi:hypothetical protein